jgi:hypothetical protein
MPVTFNLNDFISTRLNESSKILYQELDEIVINTRWLTSIVLAEIGGLAAYRHMEGKTSLSLPLSIVVFILSIALMFFILSALTSRIEKRSIGKLIIDRIKEMNDILSDKNETDNNKDKLLPIISDQILNDISKRLKRSRNYEIVGLFFFLISSIFAAVYLFVNEIVLLFC